MLQFPEGFRWGAATAAHQVEGGNVASDWWAREHAPGTTVPEPSGDACDSYHRYPEDMRLLAEAGLDTYRFSVEWARVEPEPGLVSRAALDHYRRMVETARSLGVTPMVTLHHFTLPRWLADRGGWRAPEAVDAFARYTETVLPVVEDVDRVCTINEPNMVAVMAGADGGESLVAAGLPAPDPVVTQALVAAHRRSREVLSAAPLVRSGWTVATQDHQPEPGCEQVAHEYGYPRDALFLEAAADDDWVGVQAYTRTKVGPDGPLPVPDDVETTLTGWEYYPPALADGVRLAARWAPGVPVLVTENGIATADDGRRVDYLRDALRGLHEVMAEGVGVQGYLAWSLLDNYEWGSYAPTFGLVAVDRTTFARTPRPSLRWLGEVARANALPG
ncbi:family 1 glycosylhydrolase [Pseudokineococcus basanitobsidens]|uniref:Family 1 glycosylhydrolase n=1 Tax=Pseudokineococcus basanitobsidens TaxID=1926649 RepID=A0ABU8RG24_9ACTN